MKTYMKLMFLFLVVIMSTSTTMAAAKRTPPPPPTIQANTMLAKTNTLSSGLSVAKPAPQPVNLIKSEDRQIAKIENPGQKVDKLATSKNDVSSSVLTLVAAD